MEPTQLSITEHAVLGLLAEGPTHGFAISRELRPDSFVGRVITVRQPLVYRALARLVEAGLAEAVTVEPGAAGPQRVIHRITPRGRKRLTLWLSQPVQHVRDLRIEFLLKLAFLHRSSASPLALVEGQRAALQETLDALAHPDGETGDPTEIWRKHQAAAAAAYLIELERLYRRN